MRLPYQEVYLGATNSGVLRRYIGTQLLFEDKEQL